MKTMAVDVDNTVHLFEQEELELLEIPLVLSTIEVVGEVEAAAGGGVADDIRHCSESTQPAVPAVLRLRQFGSSSDQWGIHSSVWDGGIALLYYVATRWDPVVEIIKEQQQSQQQLSTKSTLETLDNSASIPTVPTAQTSRAYLVDLGSGTGVTGLGIAAMTRGTCSVALTDQADALDLLHDNVQRNVTYFATRNDDNGNDTSTTSTTTSSLDSTLSTPPTVVVHELTWGHSIASVDEWLPSFLHMKTCQNLPPLDDARAQHVSRRQILITGADIVYRPSLFVPLLTTLVELRLRLLALDDTASIEIYLSCQSVRSHLNDFWRRATAQEPYGFVANLVAIVELDAAQKTNLAKTVVKDPPMAAIDKDADTDSTASQLPLPLSTDSLPKGHEINWIVSLTKP